MLSIEFGQMAPGRCDEIIGFIFSVRTRQFFVNVHVP
jgi:hypothetical protein